jgi:hypothetical protein
MIFNRLPVSFNAESCDSLYHLKGESQLPLSLTVQSHNPVHHYSTVSMLIWKIIELSPYLFHRRAVDPISLAIVSKKSHLFQSTHFWQCRVHLKKPTVLSLPEKGEWNNKSFVLHSTFCWGNHYSYKHTGYLRLILTPRYPSQWGIDFRKFKFE